ncbi:MAG: HAMP domain-containing protein [Leptospiraceae bacterium]|nr:HAMP domain-containing protein [Leptospiraceae bacterium]MCP5501003.1 HAMP domain-containing protein [Leptospiraceae bacterium]
MEFFKRLHSGELKYYLRDLYIFLFSVFISIVLAETLIFNSSEKNDVVDKIFVYIYFIFPLFSLSLIGSYVYRSSRIRKTGKVRSIIRYRITLAFIFVSILPSIPIFLLSSNVVGKLVESFYRIDISDALKSAVHNINMLEERDRQILIKKLSLLKKELRETEITEEQIQKVAIEIKLNEIEDLYFCILFKDKLVMENKSIYNNLQVDDFKDSPRPSFQIANLYKTGIAYVLVKTKIDNTDYSVLVGKRVHKGNESTVYNTIFTEQSYNATNLWKSKVPFTLRLSLGIFTIIIFGISILLSFIMARQISRPIVQLAYATQMVSKGETDVFLNLKEEGEMGILIDSFNQMTRDLKTKNEEIIHIQRIAAWKEVAQRMAHEIKNPLTPIQLSAERIRKKLDSQDKESFRNVVLDGTNTIIGQVKVLEHLVKEFSEFARMPTPILVNQPLNPLIEEAVNLFKDTPNIRFELNLSRNLPEVFIDRKLFLGVINNLIKNAVEAIQNSMIELEITEFQGIIRLRTRLEKKYLHKYVVLSVEDNGPGIPMHIRQKIFEPYFSTKESHGTGIGLAIVKKTVFDHQGRISIENTSLGGGHFKIELPIANSSK